jgi:hypothetical protein
VNAFDLLLDNFEHIASLDSRASRTRHSLWTTSAPVPTVTSIPGWSFRPARTPIAARTKFSLCQDPVCFR